MLKKWKSISVTTVLAATLLLGANATPCAVHLSNGSTTTETTAITTAPVATNGKPVSSDTKPDAPKKQKSVLDADVLESPFSFFKDMTSSGSEDDDSDVTFKPSAVVLALKALAATLLSTIM